MDFAALNCKKIIDREDKIFSTSFASIWEFVMQNSFNLKYLLFSNQSHKSTGGTTSLHFI